MKKENISLDNGKQSIKKDTYERIHTSNKVDAWDYLHFSETLSFETPKPSGKPSMNNKIIQKMLNSWLCLNQTTHLYL